MLSRASVDSKRILHTMCASLDAPPVENFWLCHWWRIQKFVLGEGRHGGLRAVDPAGVQGAESPLRVWGRSPRSCGISAFCVMWKAFSLISKYKNQLSVTGYIFTYIKNIFLVLLRGGAIAPPHMDPPLSKSGWNWSLKRQNQRSPT